MAIRDVSTLGPPRYFSPTATLGYHEAFVVRLKCNNACQMLVSDVPVIQGREQKGWVSRPRSPGLLPQSPQCSTPLVQPFLGSCAPSLRPQPSYASESTVSESKTGRLTKGLGLSS